MGEIAEHLAQRESEDARVRGRKTEARPLPCAPWSSGQRWQGAQGRPVSRR